MIYTGGGNFHNVLLFTLPGGGCFRNMLSFTAPGGGMKASSRLELPPHGASPQCNMALILKNVLFWQ